MLSSRKNLDFLKDFPSLCLLLNSAQWGSKAKSKSEKKKSVWFEVLLYWKLFKVRRMRVFKGNNFTYTSASLLWEHPMHQWTQKVSRIRKIQNINTQFLANLLIQNPSPALLETLRIPRKNLINWGNTTNIFADGCTTPGEVLPITTPKKEKKKKSLFTKIIFTNSRVQYQDQSARTALYLVFCLPNKPG